MTDPALKDWGLPLIRPRVRGDDLTSRNVLRNGRRVRDIEVWNYPILPGALSVYSEIASTREWFVVGKPNQVSKVLDALHNTRSYNLRTGHTEYGFEEYLTRRVFDHLILGRTQFTYDESGLEYLDPTWMTYNRVEEDRPVLPTDTVWLYGDGRQFTAGQVVTMHSRPLGAEGLFQPPISDVLPLARLAWLLQEFDTAALDGRRLRDIMLVNSEVLGNALEDVIKKAIANINGSDPTRNNGVPLIGVELPPGMVLRDMIHVMGLANIPDTFNREQFMDIYVNAIAGCIGLSLRHFWNNEKTTNRALEQVQEQRQQQKGPSYFIRREQIAINQSGFMRQFGRNIRMGFIEETDSMYLETKARALNFITSALANVQKVFGASISLDDYLGWVQSEHLLPYSMRLTETTPETVQTDTMSNLAEEDDQTASHQSDLKSIFPQLHEGEVMVTHNGHLIERHAKRIAFETVLEKSVDDQFFAEPTEMTPFSDFAVHAKDIIVETFAKSVREGRSLYEAIVTQDDAQHAVYQKICTKIHKGKTLTEKDKEWIITIHEAEFLNRSS